MTAADDKRALALSFLQTVLPSEGTYFVTRKNKTGAVYRSAVDTFEEIIDRIFTCTHDAWFSTASFNDNSRSNAANVKLLRAFRVDVDCGFEKPYDTQEAGARAMVEFTQKTGLPLPGIVNSGNGLHLWWPLKEAIIKSVWECYAKALKELVTKHEFKVDVASIADSARILRLPGTYNYKDREHPKEVATEAKFFERGPYDLDQFDHLLSNGEDKEINFDYSGVLLNHENHALYKAAIDTFPNWDDRDQWFRVGCAIKRLGWDDDGYKLWVNWSKKSLKFDEAIQLKTWESIDGYAGEPITPASLLYWSKLSTGTKQEHELSTGTKEEREQKVDGEDTDWHNTPPTWQKTASGHMKENSYINTELAIEKLEIACRHNEITEAIETKFDNIWIEVNEAVCMNVRESIIIALHADPGLTHVRNAISALGNKSMYNPIIEYLDAGHWDGVERIKTWLIDCLGAEDTEANRFFGELILIAAIRRVRKPGTKFDHMLVLEGPHGIGKSTVVQILGLQGILGDGYYARTTFDRDIHRFIENIQEAWFVEWDELAGLKTGLYWENIKGSLSQAKDRARLAYAHKATGHHRRCIFIGTTNESVYIPNKEGNRRFWPVQLKSTIDLEKFRFVVPQLYAEANFKEKGYFDINIVPKKIVEDVEKLQLSRTILPIVLDDLEDMPGWKDVAEGIQFISTKTLNSNLNIFPKDALSKNFNSNELRSALKAMGCKTSKRTIDGKNCRGWERQKVIKNGESK